MPPTPDHQPQFNVDELGDGPYLLYCHWDGSAALLNEQGTAGNGGVASCAEPEMVSAERGFMVSRGDVLQIPDFEFYGRCLPVAGGWSGDGRYLPAINESMFGYSVHYFDLATTQCRFIYATGAALHVVGLSPTGRWAVVMETIQDFSLYRNRIAPSRLVAVSLDGQVSPALYDIYDQGVIDNSIPGWLSETELVMTRSHEECRLALVHLDLTAGTARTILGPHGPPAIDPEHDVIMLNSPGRCGDSDSPQDLVRLSAANGWQPELVLAPESWPSWRNIARVEWMPELERFVIWSAPIEERPAHLGFIDSQGDYGLELSYQGELFSGVFPSPEGELILVGGGPPHGIVLYDAQGQVVRELAVPGDAFELGLREAQWFPDGSTVYFIPMGEDALYRADEGHDWRAEMVVPAVAPSSDLMLVQRNPYVFEQVCYKRKSLIHVGMQVVINDQNPQTIQILSAPDAERGEPLGVLAPGQQAEIVDGPICVDFPAVVWWYVLPEGQDQPGWVSERLNSVDVLFPSER